MSILGQRIEHYRVTGHVGRGGMGEVYRAMDERLGREVAIKVLPLGLALAGERLERRHARLFREAQAASALNHPGIVTLFDVGSWRGRLYLVMELIEGDRVSDLVARGVSADEALRLCAEAADALGAAHARGIFHRDVKSDNLMCTREGRLKVVDFGLAKLRIAPRSDDDVNDVDIADEAAESASPGVETVPDSLDPDATPLEDGPVDVTADESRDPEPPGAVVAAGADADGGLTRAGEILGTPAYLAPEHADGAPADPQTEVFSLGVVLYELLVGRRPWAGETAGATLKAMLATTPPSPLKAAPDRRISAAASAVAMRAISRDRGQRFADMPAFAAAARAAIAGDRARASNRRRWLFVSALVAVPAVVAGLALLGARVRHAPTPSAAAPAPPSSPVTVRGTRRITFEPGCEEYPWFAPDGKTLLFDAVVHEPAAPGDTELFALDLETGARRRLTHSPEWDHSVSVSPDGKQIAYLHRTSAGGEVRVLPIDGDTASPPKILGKGTGYPVWTADGAVVASSGGSEVIRWSAPFEGAPPTVLTTAPNGGHAYNFAAFRDGHLFVAWRPVQAITKGTLSELAPGGALVEREHYSFVSESSLFAAPSQEAIYYARHATGDVDEIVRRPRGGGEITALPAGIAPRSGFSIASDGKRLAFSTCGTSSLVARVREGAAAERLGGRGEWDDYQPSRLDAHRILVTSNRTGMDQVFVVNLESGEARALTAGSAGASRASASPDRSMVLYLDAREGLRIVPIAGGQAVAVTSDPTDTSPQFTRDGARVVFERRTAEGSRIYVVPAGGGEPRPITPVGAREPAVSPVEDKVVYVMTSPGKGRTLMIADLAGAHAAPLSRDLPADDYLNPRFSPDGRRVLVLRKRADILEVRVEGGPARLRWNAGSDGLDSADYAPDGDAIVAAVLRWEGDIWLVDGEFR